MQGAEVGFILLEPHVLKLKLVKRSLRSCLVNEHFISPTFHFSLYQKHEQTKINDKSLILQSIFDFLWENSLL